jgi:hypothetical protein
VDPFPGEPHTGCFVVDGRHRDDAEIQSELEQCIEITDAWHSMRTAKSVTLRIGDSHEFYFVKLAEYPSMVAAHHPETQDAGSQRHWLTALITASTSAFVRSGLIGRERTSAAARSVSGRSVPVAKGGCRWIGTG